MSLTPSVGNYPVILPVPIPTRDKAQPLIDFFKNDFDINLLPYMPDPSLAFTQQYLNVMIESLNLARQKYPNQSVLIVQPTVTSSSLPSKILEAFQKSLQIDQPSSTGQVDPNKEIKPDVIYFNRYLDQCQLYSDPLITTNDQLNSLTQSKYPQGSLAIMVSPIGRDRLLGLLPGNNQSYINYATTQNFNITLQNNLRSGNLIGLVWVPNLFEYNKFQQVRLPPFTPSVISSYLAECSPNVNPTGSGSSVAPLGWGPLLIGLFLIILLILIGWAFYTIGPYQPRKSGWDDGD